MKLMTIFILTATSFSNLAFSQDSTLSVSKKVVDPIGNEIITVRGTTRGSVKKYIKPAGSNEYQAIREEPYRYITATPDLQEQGKRIGDSFYHSETESCVEVTSSEGKVEYFVGPSSSDDLSQYRPVTDSFRKEEGDFQVEEDSLVRLPENIKPLDIHKLENGEYIYFDRDVNHPDDTKGVRAFQGTPGNMQQIEVAGFIPRPPVRCPAPNTYILGDGRRVVAGGMNNYIEQTQPAGQDSSDAAPARRPRGAGCGSTPGLNSKPLLRAEDNIDANSLGITGFRSEPIDYPSPCSMPGLGVTLNQLNQQESPSVNIRERDRRRGYDIETQDTPAPTTGPDPSGSDDSRGR